MLSPAAQRTVEPLVLAVSCHRPIDADGYDAHLSQTVRDVTFAILGNISLTGLTTCHRLNSSGVIASATDGLTFPANSGRLSGI